ncbi:P3 protein isoform X2 [Loxodonta africana]|uniref:P3 protein isoform X2 n=1 Tax=Loxodonta africana TaxID=9785 RepID=UPI0005404D50|nr:P3 protein isoform X2 [Loxodonta africana]
MRQLPDFQGELCHPGKQPSTWTCPWTLLRTSRRYRLGSPPKLQRTLVHGPSGEAMVLERPGLGRVGGCPGPLSMLRAALLLASLPWRVRGTASGNLSTALGHTVPLMRAHYLSIGDGSVMEFEFPEESEGIIVISSQYPAQSNGTRLGPTLRVTSLDTAVLTIKNVLPAEDAPATLSADLAHFSENPILYLLLPLIFVNKCSFGCKVELEVLKGFLHSPQPMLLGLLGQFLVMPFYAFLMAKVFMLPKALALGLIITCSSPGGGGSYLFSLLLGGDVTLAISMTFISTVAATGFLPLSSAIYSHLLSIHETLHVPISKILGTLLFIAIPIAAGVVIKSKLPRFSQLLLQVIKPFSFVLLLGGLFLAYRMGIFILAGVRFPIVLVGLTVPLVGLLVGYCLATCLKLPVAQRRTVSIEVGVQNSLLALAMLQLSFRHLQADFASQAPFIVALSGTSEMLALVMGHFIYSSLFPVH